MEISTLLINFNLNKMLHKTEFQNQSCTGIRIFLTNILLFFQSFLDLYIISKIHSFLFKHKHIMSIDEEAVD